MKITRSIQIRLCLVSLLFIWGCSADLKDYQQASPKFELFEYFSGNVKAWGMVQDYSGKQTRRFEVEIVGSVDNNTLTLVEDFVFDDGEIDQRIWRITRLSDGLYQGEADDIIGVAEGMELGNALQWRYDFELQVDGSSLTVSFDDWLYRQDEKHVFNLTKIKKFGVEVGTITLFFQRQ
ncbi:DUF3833 domain-containing protein [Vibrio sp. IRLE0018]|uniref:DUF3833 domain-containing protein n=1 Tax=Vibrio floridensis TaxID=2908007 RepID=UPI001A24ACBE|nr:DUF3833 domain-containing protein [Vibrio floridensis]MCF8778258.1 DUF3833 domain-containing protein [Vibrio floridensis]HAS6348520.1 DUF3833 family protein [Vibrio vulnificus]